MRRVWQEAQWEGPGHFPGEGAECVLAALVGFVQQGRELQQELEGTIDIFGKVLESQKCHWLPSLLPHPQPALQAHRDTG